MKPVRVKCVSIENQETAYIFGGAEHDPGEQVGSYSLIGPELSHYRVLGHLGSGGMGEVYLAEDVRLGRKVALKVLPADLAHEPTQLARFQHEARALAAISHPNIVTIYSVEEQDGLPFLTMELVEGRRLSELISPQGMSPGQLLDVATQLADGLAAAHEHGVLHRDL